LNKTIELEFNKVTIPDDQSDEEENFNSFDCEEQHQSESIFLPVMKEKSFKELGIERVENTLGIEK
jgi:hypothetical protein